MIARASLIGTRAVGLRAKFFRKIRAVGENNLDKFALRRRRGGADTYRVEASASDRRESEPLPDYDCGPDATLSIKEDHHVSCH